ncbi:CRISPR-associated helicase Cas3' [Paenibacillus sp. 481]|uniref:CRISPR-associated helicase Cas3' n=1 Tax=Paenibacillus sp. 481 TaxID=2835869 RepID=UPI001E2B5467|nr:CRISPR-associated helicase Cas3' [Paenibacillus sp. 481]UHA71861.1 CRISPR-associated helicase Cas3' [Paenibacillus sp. 481]
MYYAHRTECEDRKKWQELKEHLKEVATNTALFAKVFDASEWGSAIGLLHDLGKYSDKFQRRLKGSSIRVDHSTAGAQAIMKHWGKNYGIIPAYIIAGHHSGLPNYGSTLGHSSDLAMRLENDRIEPYEHGCNEIQLPDLPSPPKLRAGIDCGMQFSLYTRMLFSCLIDADSLNTEKYADSERHGLRQPSLSIEEMIEKYENHMKPFAIPSAPIDSYRNELLHECIAAAKGETGLYSLSMPTGSGKTLASLGFALYHAKEHGLSRIIYVIPYTSIIEQNASIFRGIFGADVVLEHHSNVQRIMKNDEVEGDRESEEQAEHIKSLNIKLQLAEENWDASLIVTTNVQFFESLFSSKRSKCRKLHRIANSVVIFDEAQMINGEFFKPSIYAVDELSRNYKVTALFCTATQPEIKQLFPEHVQSKINIYEIVKDVPLRSRQFERTRLHQLGRQTINEIAGHMRTQQRALCIVNTRKTAREVYRALSEEYSHPEDGLFHLSARMCPQHRLHFLTIIQQRLKDGLPCRVISTQLIEAGVDIDFPVVFRELAGLDSIAQAAGRCNRNDNLPNGQRGNVYVFELEQGLPPGWFSTVGAVARDVMKQYGEQSLSVESIKHYFNELYFYQTTGKDRTDAQDILGQLNCNVKRMQFPFKDVDKSFNLIGHEMQTVLIPYDDDAKRLLDKLRDANYIRPLLRSLQRYAITLYKDEFDAYKQAGALEEVRDGVYKLTNLKSYSDDLGLLPFSIEHHKMEALFA